jgi:anaerobic ribonucleoside-triphosphate reductase activating protein
VRADVLQIARISEATNVLGPGPAPRAVVWVQGCPQRCPGCVAVEMLPFEGGEAVAVDALAERLLGLAHIGGVTFSGGEPFSQAAALARLCAALRAERPELSLMSYTGWTVERLTTRGTRAQRDLLGWLDILIDGRYVRRRHAALLWRGSSNQRIHRLTDRHAEADLPDGSQGLEFEVVDGAFRWTGVPPAPDFRHRLRTALAANGIETEGERLK